MKMRSALLSHDGFHIAREDIPPFADGEVLIKLVGCGICSGDVFVYKNRDQLSRTPRRLGHEGSGWVIGVGRNVIGFDLDDMVTTFALPAYAEYLVAKPDGMVKLPPEVDPLYALGEAIACCVHAAGPFWAPKRQSCGCLGLWLHGSNLFANGPIPGSGIYLRY